MKRKVKVQDRPKEEEATLTRTLKDWRVLLMVGLVLFSLVSIYGIPPGAQNGLTGNLQLGLDLEGGSWIQLSFRSEVIRFETDGNPDALVANLRSALDAEVHLIEEDRLEIRKPFTREELAPVFEEFGAKIVTYDEGVSKETADQVKLILEEKVNGIGTKDARINTLTGLNGVTQYIRLELAGVDITTAQEIVGSQGKFEIRIQTTGNETEHVLYGDTITSVSTPTRYPIGSDLWGVGFTLNDEGAAAFRSAAITYGATSNPEAHPIMMLLDDEVVYSASLNADLAAQLQGTPVRELRATTGAGDEGLEDARTLEIHLRAGALPVDVTIAGSGTVPATLGDHFKIMCIIAAIFALVGVAALVFYWYREPAIVLPMIGTNIAEIIILLGIAVYIQQLDLASIAGLIAVLGTGIDQLVIITDEVLHEGRVPSQTLYMKRFSRALGIIMVSALTTIIAMLPLALMDLANLKGFAIITILGVIIGVLVTRPAYGKIIMAILSRNPGEKS
ncbi:MAG TPA: preprotein translocase subunit SecD [Methanoculleus sp.]|nr:preprotein translocase subunit SecD [Methanoculleus sp.]